MIESESEEGTDAENESFVNSLTLFSKSSNLITPSKFKNIDSVVDGSSHASDSTV